MSRFPTLLSPVRVGPVELRNRVVMLPHVTHYATPQGKPTDRLGAYYLERARNGVALIVTGSQFVHPTGGGPGTIPAYDIATMAAWKPLLDPVQRHGTTVVAQLSHHGPEAVSWFTGRELWAASAVPNPFIGELPRPVARADIEELVAGFVTAAVNALEVGFDGVEIKVGHDGILRTFLSPLSNRRDDDYGGSTENRGRIVVEVLDAVRGAVGGDVLLGIRLCADERLPGGYGLEDAVRFARGWVDAIDYVSTDHGTWQSMDYQIPPADITADELLATSARLRQDLNVPVIAAGRITDPQTAEAALADGKADLIGLARPLLTDPEWVTKAAHGLADHIRPCVACNQLCVGNLARNMPIGCVHNPAAGRELEWGSVVERARSARRVIVVGGGVAGMKAAETAARRGHTVTLFEASDQLGGQVAVAARARGRQAWGGIVDHCRCMLESLEVDVRLGVRASVDSVSAEAPEVVVVATGARPLPPPFPVAEGVDVRTSIDVLQGNAPHGLSVVVLDYGRRAEGATTVEHLAADNRVRWVTPAPWAGMDLDPATAAPLRRRLGTLGVEVRPQTTVVAYDGETATLFDVLCHKADRAAPVDAVVVAGNRASVNADVVPPGVEHHVVGDAVAPRDVGIAMLEAERIGRSL